MASIVNNSDENGIDVCTPLIGENPENDPFQFLEEEKQPDTMEPHDSYLGYDKEPNIGGYNNGHHRRETSGNQVIPMEDYHDYPSHNTSIMGYDHVPDASSSQPQTLVVRNRKKSIKLEQIFDKLDQLDQLDGDDDQYFQRTRSKRCERSKTLKERKIERNASQKDSSLKTTKTLGERYAEMKNNEDVTARNLATLMRQDREDSTLRKMNKLRHSKGSKTWKNVKRSYNEFSHRISLWYSTFKEIEGEYGTAVMTYFKFLKWLLRLNFYTMIITFCVITIPFLVLGPSSYEDSVRSVNNSQDSIDCTKEYIHYMDNFTSQESLDEKVIDFLQGTGWMERTILFYGVYYNKTYYSEIEKTEKIYNMSLAYLLAVGCSFIICFILIVKNASKSAKVSLGLESSVAMYTNKVFAAWDYCINNQKNAKVKSVGIKFEITADLKEQKRTIDWDGKEFSDRCAIYFKRVVINLLVIILLGGSLALIAYTAQQMIELQKKEFEEIVILIIQYVPYLTITILNLAVPILFQKLVQFEMYKYETELKLTLARSVLLRLSSPIVLLAILYQQLIVTSKDSTSGKCGNVRWSATGSGLRGDVKCWETYVGQQVYKLVLLDLFVECGILFFGNVPRSIVYRKFKDKSKVIKMVGPQEFDLTQSVVDIVYSQNICWLGMMFSPLIPFMTFLKILIFFYSKKFLLKYCEAQERPYRTSRSNSLFMLVLLLSFVFAAAPIGYMVGRLQPSQSCGPFRLYADANVVMFNTVSYTVASWPGVLRGIFSFLGTVGFFVPVIIALCLLMYYYWLLGQGYKKTEKILQHQLKLEGQDKRYLMDRVTEFLESTEVNQNTLHNAAL
ncbi:transmembrane channel-like protein 7 isoform X1 [Mytilus galloprovincialis]|uniref:transmembrane channel-like protein 7 isoform X1 n=2 Tax=Mytilus galloprovincialis TaxID=29158 RepID=UPI003F7B380F